jgi:hypothetical protein
MKSSKKRGHQILGVLAAKRAEGFLLDCANLGANHVPHVKGDSNIASSTLRQLNKRYPDIMPHMDSPLRQRAMGATFSYLSFLLRKGWDAPTLREREWYFGDAESLARYTASEQPEGWTTDYAPWITYRFSDPPARATTLEAVFYYLRRRIDDARHCGNPDCPAPYFFATKKGQKYCTPECAEPSRRASKLRWWNENRAGNPKNELKKRKESR